MTRRLSRHTGGKRKTSRGMTLIEVMVALAVFSVAMLAVLDASSQSLNAQGYLEQRTLAGWVAENVMARSHLEPLTPGKAEGKEQMAGQSWLWQRRVEATLYPGFMRVDVEVRTAEQGEPIALLTSFVGSY